MGRRRLHCVISPARLRELAAGPDPSLAQAAKNTLDLTVRFQRQHGRRLLEKTFLPEGDVGGDRLIHDCLHTESIGQAEVVRKEGGKGGKDPTVDSAYRHLGTVRSFFERQFSWRSYDGHGAAIDAFVNFGALEKPFLNATWGQQGMIFGSGDGKEFGDFGRSLDVIAHEYAHGVTEAISLLGYENEGAALVESIADVFAVLVGQEAAGVPARRADWRFGVELRTPAKAGDCLRSLAQPGTRDSYEPQAAHVNAMRRSGVAGDVAHANAGVPSHAFFRVATAMGGNAWEEAGHIWFDALPYCRPDTDFDEFAGITCAVAKKRNPKGRVAQKALAAAWGAVGVRPAEVKLTLPADPGDDRGGGIVGVIANLFDRALNPRPVQLDQRPHRSRA